MSSIKNGLLRQRSRDFGIVFAALVLVVILSVSTKTFLTPGNMVNLLDQVIVVGIFACAVTVPMIAGVFDLSMSSIAALSAICGIYAINSLGLFAGVLASVLVGTFLGLLNGLAVTYGRVNSFIATLASSMVFVGVATVLTNGQIVRSDDLSLQVLSRPSELLGITWGSLVFILIAVLAGILIAKTVYGRNLYAVGGNPAAAAISGISVVKTHITAFMISGALSAVAGLVLASRALSAQPATGKGLEFTAIAAAVIGGVSLNGGSGAIWRSVLGVFLLQLIGNGFNLLGAPTIFQQVVQGALILFAVSLDQFLRARDV
ncbi:MAG: ABC transporter permease [Propionibacteriaceae bacterium]|jgi:ribose transport system permease protein|nr:ABC transporter permease [Propionibacteriaceae bacterium]